VTNVSDRLTEQAALAPDRTAVVEAGGARLGFEQLEARVTDTMARLAGAGIQRGDRVSLFVRAGIDLVAITHALFRLGAVPVLIDPGMGRRALMECITRVRPRALVSVSRVQLARRLFPAAFASVEIAVCVGPGMQWGAPRLEDLAPGTTETAPIEDDDDAAILFTSGSTGTPKGVLYSHGNFNAQLDALAGLYTLEPGEVDVACFPLFALFDHALGMTSVFPDLDPSRPGRCDPARVFAALEEGRATFTFGSPAIWRRVLAWAEQNARQFTTLRRLTIAGAPVPPQMIAGLRALLPAGGEVHTPYGATEALPVASIAGEEIISLRNRIEGGDGTCVGRPAPGIEIRLAPITDDAIASWDAPGMERVASGREGEICVRGAVVTGEYVGLSEATRAAKIPTGDASEVWHRMGDIGRFDDEGRLWFLGRKAHRIETDHGLLMPVPVENACNRAEGVQRSALVGVGVRGRERPLLVVETEGKLGRARRAEVEVDVARIAADQVGEHGLAGVRFHPAFPVDVRHNAKIRREDLKLWAEARVR